RVAGCDDLLEALGPGPAAEARESDLVAAGAMTTLRRGGDGRGQHYGGRRNQSDETPPHQGPCHTHPPCGRERRRAGTDRVYKTDLMRQLLSPAPRQSADHPIHREVAHRNTVPVGTKSSRQW